jgi:uncharacterized membrane protein YqiK
MKTIGVVVVLLMIVGLVVSAIEIMLGWWTFWRRVRRLKQRRAMQWPERVSEKTKAQLTKPWTDEEHAMLFGGTGLKRWR